MASTTANDPNLASARASIIPLLLPMLFLQRFRRLDLLPGGLKG